MPTQSTYPFFETDFAKVFSEFRIPGFDVEAILAAQRRNIEAVTTAGVQDVLAGADRSGRGELLRHQDQTVVGYGEQDDIADLSDLGGAEHLDARKQRADAEQRSVGASGCRDDGVAGGAES